MVCALDHYAREGGWTTAWSIRRVERRVSPERRHGSDRRGLEHEGATPVAGNVRLTKREREIRALIAAGLGNKEIARRLNIATNTVKSHVHNMLGKLAALTPPDRRQSSRGRRGTSRRSYRFSR
ncbi:MAG: hypothetical protein DMD54_11065 [Gemmatimonadetes bacterium]|nr:MAG: hypothetical protein DMD54_11065 [Gemmatimonadota bacterium]